MYNVLRVAIHYHPICHGKQELNTFIYHCYDSFFVGFNFRHPLAMLEIDETKINAKIKSIRVKLTSLML